VNQNDNREPHQMAARVRLSLRKIHVWDLQMYARREKRTLAPAGLWPGRRTISGEPRLRAGPHSSQTKRAFLFGPPEENPQTQPVWPSKKRAPPVPKRSEALRAGNRHEHLRIDKRAQSPRRQRANADDGAKKRAAAGAATPFVRNTEVRPRGRFTAASSRGHEHPIAVTRGIRSCTLLPR
jgi:hypothetical protein